MKTKSITRTALFLAALTMLWIYSCIGGQGPGSDGAEETGSSFRILQLDIHDGGMDDDMLGQVDIVDSDSATVFLDPWPVQMNVNLANWNVCGQECPLEKGTGIYVKGYTVEYFSSDPAAVRITPLKNVKYRLYLGPGENVEFTTLAMNVDQKYEYWTKKGASVYDEVLYEFRVTFYGVNEFGYKTKTTASSYAVFADWASQ